MAFCIALAVRDMRLTIDEALQAATLGGAGPCDATTSGASRPARRADLVVLDAPSYTHLVYRPGVPLVHPSSRPGGASGDARDRRRPAD